MQDQQNARRIPIGLVAAISAAVLTAGGGAAWWGWNSRKSSNPPPAPITAQSPTPAPVQRPTEETVQVYWVNNVNNKIELVPSAVTLTRAEKPSEILQEALQSLLTGPTAPAFATTIPKDTKLLQVAVKADGVHVDLSEEFTEGGGSASMTGRLAQVLYTASSLDPNAKVWIAIEGEPLEVLGGEGIMVDQPLTRENFEKNFTL